MLFTDVTKEIGRSVTAIKIGMATKDHNACADVVLTIDSAGGHFDGSLVLHWKKKIFIADSLITVPVRREPHQLR